MTHANEYLEYAQLLADLARLRLQLLFQLTPLKMGLQTKEGGTPVTRADIEIETAIHNLISERYPHHAFLGEELGEKSSAAPQANTHYWVVDPIDGTAAFTQGKPLFTTLIGLLVEGSPLLGVIENPVLQERWFSCGNGTWLTKGACLRENALPCSTSAIIDLANARLSCTTPEMFRTKGEQSVFKQLRSQVKTMSWGGDAYAYGLLASGHIEIILESDLKFHDVAALIPIVKNAGGCISDWQGNELKSGAAFDGQCLATANQSLHESCLALVHG